MFISFPENKEQFNKFFNSTYPEEKIIYREELTQIMNIMRTNSNYRILLLGSPGSGKSTLINILSNYTEYKNAIDIIPGYEFLDDNYIFLSRNSKEYLIVDGLDEVKNPDKLFHYIHCNNFNKVICTLRSTTTHKPYNNVIDIDFFTHIIELKPLTIEQKLDFLNRLNLDSNIMHLVLEMLLKSESLTTPQSINALIISLLHDLGHTSFYSNYHNLLYQYGHGINFDSDIILPKKDLILPSTEMLTDISIVNDKLLSQAKRNPNIIHKFTPHEFELFICEVLNKQGYNVKLTKQTRDGGKDLIVVQHDFLGEFCIYVECKRYNKSHPVNVSIVRELYGIINADDVTAGMLITTSYFTKDAKEFTEKIKHRMSLKDFNDLTQALNNL